MRYGYNFGYSDLRNCKLITSANCSVEGPFENGEQWSTINAILSA